MLRSLKLAQSTFILNCSRQSPQVSYFCTKPVAATDDKEKVEEDDMPVVLQHDNTEDPEARKLRIEKLRNKSGLLPQHRRILHDELPYEEHQSWVHETLRYQRTMLGRYGLKSGVDPRICFPTRAEREDRAEWERVAFPKTLQQMMETNREEKEARVARIRQREDDIEKKLGKLDGWLADLNARIAKKEAQARAVKEKKERLVEEVRRQFGFALDPRDDKFKEMLAQKEKEEKKKEKEAKRAAREAKTLEKLVAKGKASEAAANEPAPTTDAATSNENSTVKPT